MYGNAATASRVLACAILCLLLALCGIIVAPASVAAPSPGEGAEQALGNDVSWPQCNKALPAAPAFGIVGVNNGLASTTNPCLAELLRWAEAITVNPTDQPSVALYVNTANPGHAGSWWPTSNNYPAAHAVSNPYGTCKDKDVGTACAYMYGYAKAYDDANIRGISSPSDYLWWLDVETGNSWSLDKNANRAVLEGMTDLFHSIGADVGIYSSAYQWGQIVGTVSRSSNLYALPTWLAGALNAFGATANCSNAPLNPGGTVTLTQFVSRGFDYNHSCI
ncbi:hypothetical protein FYJ92_17625 [Pseudarthrobacter sp. NBSH8]|nr:hypothetical protein [Pseudarthrobacter sp. NBSH8]QNE16048.1 hypothetical protein FYJ92_17625 [Pseudarthrobacter sp. NBSH8]